MTTERFRQQAENFISETLTSAIPGTTVDPGSATNNIMVRGGSVIASSLFQEIDHMLLSRDISNPESISTTDMDTNLEPLLVERDTGDVSRGFVNIHFNDRKSRTIPSGQRFLTADRELGFVTESELFYEPSDYLVNNDDSTFYLRVPISAESTGPDYDVDVGEINTSASDRLGQVYLRNTDKMLGGQEAQTNTEFLAMAKRSVSTRTPLNVDGTILTLQKLFGTKLLDVLIVGNGDPEMLRDELYSDNGVMSLEPIGSPTGIHIGGRTDVYHWYPTINYVEVTVDLTIDLILSAQANSGSTSIQAAFAPGTTSTNTIPSSGVLILDTGGSSEESVSYSSFTFNSLTGIYTFTLSLSTSFDHILSIGVKVAGTGEISIGQDLAIDTLPVLKVQSVRILDPLTLAPIGDELKETTPESSIPGWYLQGFNRLNHMSSKETKSIKIDEKRAVQGNQALNGSDAELSSGRILTSLSSDFTGHQGKDITFSDGVQTVVRAIVKVISPTQIQYADGDEVMADSTGNVFFISTSFQEYLQYPIRISYYTHTEIQSAQDSFDAGRTRILCSDILSRSFLPIFLDFTIRYKGPGTEEEVRVKMLELIQQAQGSGLGSGEGIRFDVSDIVAAAYGDGLADSVETPFEIKITRVNVDGSKTIKWVSPSRDTVTDLILSTALLAGETVVTATKPVQIPESTIPEKGRLFLGAFYGNQETLAYDRVLFSGLNMIFILTEGQSVGFTHNLNEPLRVSVADFDPANVITDGVISDERQFRPYFGTVVVEEIS